MTYEKVWVVCSACVFPLCGLGSRRRENVGVSTGGEFKGQTVTVLIIDPHSAVVESWKPEWEALTGAKVEMVVVPYASLYVTK